MKKYIMIDQYLIMAVVCFALSCRMLSTGTAPTLAICGIIGSLFVCGHEVMHCR